MTDTAPVQADPTTQGSPLGYAEWRLAEAARALAEATTTRQAAAELRRLAAELEDSPCH